MRRWIKLQGSPRSAYSRAYTPRESFTGYAMLPSSLSPHVHIGNTPEHDIVTVVQNDPTFALWHHLPAPFPGVASSLLPARHPEGCTEPSGSTHRYRESPRSTVCISRCDHPTLSSLILVVISHARIQGLPSSWSFSHLTAQLVSQLEDDLNCLGRVQFRTRPAALNLPDNVSPPDRIVR